MRGFMLWRWWRPIERLADEATYEMTSALILHHAITNGASEWPRETDITIVGKHYLMKVAKRFASGCTSAKRIAVSSPPHPVLGAPPATVVHLAAASN